MNGLWIIKSSFVLVMEIFKHLLLKMLFDLITKNQYHPFS